MRFQVEPPQNMRRRRSPALSVGRLASASRRHDVPNATSDVPSATNNPNDGGGYACDDVDGPSSLALSESPSLLQARYSSRSL
jgi:hypothetical protein